MDFFRDSIWQFYGAIIGILALIVAIVIFFLQKKDKKISYAIEQKTKIVSFSDEVEDRLEIFYKGNRVKEVMLLVIKIENCGNVPIKAGDFSSDIIIKLNKDAKILQSKILNQNPENLNILTEQNDSTLNIKPLLLNQKDSFRINLIVNNYREVFIDGRIVGIKKIELTKKKIDSLRIVEIIVFMIFIGLGILDNHFYITGPNGESIFFRQALPLVLAIMAILITFDLKRKF